MDGLNKMSLRNANSSRLSIVSSSTTDIIGHFPDVPLSIQSGIDSVLASQRPKDEVSDVAKASGSNATGSLLPEPSHGSSETRSNMSVTDGVHSDQRSDEESTNQAHSDISICNSVPTPLGTACASSSRPSTPPVPSIVVGEVVTPTTSESQHVVSTDSLPPVSSCAGSSADVDHTPLAQLSSSLSTPLSDVPLSADVSLETTTQPPETELLAAPLRPEPCQQTTEPNPMNGSEDVSIQISTPQPPNFLDTSSLEIPLNPSPLRDDGASDYSWDARSAVSVVPSIVRSSSVPMLSEAAHAAHEIRPLRSSCQIKQLHAALASAPPGTTAAAQDHLTQALRVLRAERSRLTTITDSSSSPSSSPPKVSTLAELINTRRTCLSLSPTSPTSPLRSPSPTTTVFSSLDDDLLPDFLDLNEDFESAAGGIACCDSAPAVTHVSSELPTMREEDDDDSVPDPIIPSLAPGLGPRKSVSMGNIPQSTEITIDLTRHPLPEPYSSGPPRNVFRRTRASHIISTQTPNTMNLGPRVRVQRHSALPRGQSWAGLQGAVDVNLPVGRRNQPLGVRSRASRNAQFFADGLDLLGKDGLVKDSCLQPEIPILAAPPRVNPDTSVRTERVPEPLKPPRSPLVLLESSSRSGSTVDLTEKVYPVLPKRKSSDRNRLSILPSIIRHQDSDEGISSSPRGLGRILRPHGASQTHELGPPPHYSKTHSVSMRRTSVSMFANQTPSDEGVQFSGLKPKITDEPPLTELRHKISNMTRPGPELTLVHPLLPGVVSRPSTQSERQPPATASPLKLNSRRRKGGSKQDSDGYFALSSPQNISILPLSLSFRSRKNKSKSESPVTSPNAAYDARTPKSPLAIDTEYGLSFMPDDIKVKSHKRRLFGRGLGW